MQPALKFIALVIFMMPLFASAQSGKGFDYAAHRKMNKKAAKWGKSRIKASDGDYTNMHCSIRKTRRHAKKANE
jgi:hypothetical protein